jgi:hypothetical protein
MDEIAKNSNVISPNDWRRVSLALIRNNGGQVREIVILLIYLIKIKGTSS